MASQDAPLDAAQAEAEAKKVERWCIDNGVESTADLAFMFTSYNEAMGEAGRAVARAWQAARDSSIPGVSGLVRAIFMAESSGACTVAAPRHPLSPRLRPAAGPVGPSKAKAKAKSFATVKRTFERPVLRGAKSRFIQLFVVMLTIIGVHRSSDPVIGDRVRANFHEMVTEVCRKSEVPTLQRAATTWQELRVFVGVELPTAHDVAEFLRTSGSPSRAFQALKWLVRNFPLELDLSLATAPARQAGNQFGGGRQAPVLPPPLLIVLDNLLTNMLDSDLWSVAFAAFAMIYGVVRFAHLQRSHLAWYTSEMMTFYCIRGKQRGNRDGFYWSLPRYSLSGLDLAPPLVRQLRLFRKVMVKKKLACHHLAFDLLEGKPLDVQGFTTTMRQQFEMEVKNIGDMSSYSFRRVVPTISALAQLSESQKTALGGWLDKNKEVAVTSSRYNSQKSRQTDQLKLAVFEVVKRILEDGNTASWQAVSMTKCRTIFSEEFERADARLAAAASEVTDGPFQVPGMPLIRELTLEMSRVTRLKGRAMIAKRREALGRVERVAPSRS
eukprot:Skav227875  [mRNA]  locus=scaffold2896:232372:234030:+ [translate_table: standard]